MIDIKEQDLLDILISLTTIPNEDGELTPNYCFSSDLTVDLDCPEEDIVKFALEHDYKIYKVFPGETMVGGYVIIPNNGTVTPVEKMYKEFYGEVPEISEVKLDDDNKLILDESKYTKINDNYSYDYYEVYCEKSDGDIKYDDDNFSIFIRVKKNQDKPSIEEVEEFLNDFDKLNGYKVKGVWESDNGETFNIDDINDETILTYPEVLTASLKESKKKSKNKVTARDPNAQAMWGRTRSQTFKSKKGKGSFKRRSKHKTNESAEEVDLEPIDIDKIKKTESDSYKKLFEKDADRYGATIEWDTDIYPDRQYAFWYGQVCNIHYKGLVFSIYSDEWGEFIYRDKKINTVEDAEDEGFYTDDDLNNPEIEWNDNDSFYTWVSKEDDLLGGIGIQSDLNWDPVSMLEDALDIDILLSDVYEEAMVQYFNDRDDIIGEDLDLEIVEDPYKPINLNKGQKLFLYDELISGADDDRYNFLQNKDIFESPWIFIRDIDKSFEEFGNEEEALEYPWFLSINNNEDPDVPYFCDSFINTLKGIDNGYTSIDFKLNEEKLDKNYLKLLAKKHKKTDKKGAMGWWDGAKPHQSTIKGAILNKNAGNVEANITHFNMVSGAQADGGIGAVSQVSSGAIGEDLDIDLEPTSPYVFSYHSTKDYLTKGYDYDSVTERPKEFWYSRIPESAMKVSRNDYMNNKLLRRRKNNKVFKGVKKFFDDHPKSKWCIIEVQDQSKYDKYLNVYRVLMECKSHKNIKEDIEPDLDLEVVKPPKSPNNIRFEAHPREEFMKSTGWGWHKSYPEFVCPKNGIQIFKQDLKNNKYLMCKKAQQEVEKFFKNNPRKSYCVLLAFDSDGKRVDSNNIFGYKMFEDIEKHDTLNPVLFDENNKLLPEVREKLLEIAKEFTDSLEKDEIKFNLKDIKIVGSNCSYNYNSGSDIDLHLVMDTKSLKCPDDLYPLLYSAYRSLFNGKLDPTIKGIPVEIFVETDDTEQLNDETIDK